MDLQIESAHIKRKELLIASGWCLAGIVLTMLRIFVPDSTWVWGFGSEKAIDGVHTTLLIFLLLSVAGVIQSLYRAFEKEGHRHNRD